MHESIILVDGKTGNGPKMMGIGLNYFVEAREDH
jgi:hypothetical protein